MERETGQVFAKITVTSVVGRGSQRAPAGVGSGCGAARATRRGDGRRRGPEGWTRRRDGAVAESTAMRPRHGVTSFAAGDEHVLARCRPHAGPPGRNPAAGESVVHPAHIRVRAAGEHRAGSGVTLILRPDFLALVILYWCIQEPRYVGVGMAWIHGSASWMSPTPRCSASMRSAMPCSLIPPNTSGAACCASRCGSRRRRWLCCSSCARRSFFWCVSSAARRCRAGRTSSRPSSAPPLWPLLSVLLQWPQRPVRSPSERVKDRAIG